MDLNETLSVSEDSWRLVERGWSPDRAVAVGSNFLVGNGYFGYRGTSPEQSADGYVALTVTDTYDCADGRWRELCTVPNPLLVSASVAGQPVGVAAAAEVETSLDLRTGTYGQRFVQQVPVTVGASGATGAGGGQPAPAEREERATVEVTCERVASSVDLHVLAQRWQLSSDRPLDVDVAEGVDGVVWSLNGDHFAELSTTPSGDQVVATAVTGERGVRIVVAQQATVAVGGEPAPALSPPGDGGAGGRKRYVRTRRVRVEPGRSVVVESYAAVVTSNDGGDPDAAAPAAAAKAAADGYDAVAAASASRWAELWDAMDVQIGGSPVDQTALRFCAYHNRICTPAHTDHLPVGARGLSCQAYQGAAFWDQEVYNLPVFLFTDPAVARQLLVYRHRTLDGARRKAAKLGYRGAFYAWISGDTGDELCPDIFFADVLTGRPIRNHFNDWQIHVAPDVVTTLARYVEVTGDVDLLVDHGAEIAFEVARFLHSFVRYDEVRGTYHCIRLLGPDEWHENVDDNAFTNYQVRAALAFAVDTHTRLAADHPEALAALSGRLGLDDAEVRAWARVRDRLFLPAPDPETGLVEQFRGFFAHEDTTPDVVRSRLLHPQEYWGWPNGVAFATQVSKQADVVVLMWQHHHAFDEAVRRANYEYYEPRCAHFSTLSHPPHGLVAIGIGETERALEHFRKTATIDLLTTAHSVVGGTFIGGIHTAACGGAYQMAQLGFGGVDVAGDRLSVDPVLPSAWESLRYPVAWRGVRLQVTVDRTGITVDHETPGGAAVDVTVRGQVVQVAPGQSATVPSPPVS